MTFVHKRRYGPHTSPCDIPISSASAKIFGPRHRAVYGEGVRYSALLWTRQHGSGHQDEIPPLRSQESERWPALPS